MDQENIDLGFRDLLFNSGVACMLLFIIFSVRMGQEVLQVENLNTGKSQNSQFTDAFSLLVTENIKDGNYRSIALVQIEGVSETQFQQAKAQRLIKWQVTDNEMQYLNYNEAGQVMTCYLVVSKLSAASLVLKIENNQVFTGKNDLIAKLIDGKSDISGNSTGPMTYRWQNVRVSEKEVVFSASVLDTDSEDFKKDLFDLR